jgi:superfamily II DNA helicase RecQ
VKTSGTQLTYSTTLEHIVAHTKFTCSYLNIVPLSLFLLIQRLIAQVELGLAMELVWNSRASTLQEVTNTTSSSTKRHKKGLQVSLDNCNDVLCFLQDFGVFVCKEHHTAVINLNTHLLQHHNVPAATRKQVVERFSHFAPVDPAEMELPDEPAQPIEELGKPLDGLHCKTCRFITINRDTLRMHCKKNHQQAWTGDKSLLYDTVKVQSFFRTGGLQKYFIVETVEAENTEDVDVKVAVQKQLAEYKLTQQEVEQELQTLEEVAKTDKTGWFKRTGWLEFFKDRNLVHLAHQVRAPDQSERKVRLAAELTEQLVERSVKGLATLPQELRRWLRSAKQNEIDPRPLGRLQNPESQAVYASYIVKFVCFYLRVLADEEQRIIRFRQQQDPAADCESEQTSSSEADSGNDEEGSEADDDSPRPRRRTRRQTQPDLMKDARELFTWTGDQKSWAIKLWDALDGDDRAAQTEALLASISSFIFTAYYPVALSTGLIQFLAVLGIDPDMARLRTAKNYSYMLAGMVYCVRVIALEKLLPKSQRDTQTEHDRNHFLEMRHKYLADGTFSPMSEMLNMLAYGKHIGLTAGNSGNAYWSEDKQTFYLNGRPIIISRFCKMAQDLVAETEQMLWELCWVDNDEDRVAVNLKQVVDNVTFTKRRTSFVDAPGNKLLGGLTWMLTRAMTTESGRRLKRADGQWSVKAVRRYMRQVDCFLELLLCSVHVTSGQPGRGSEITTIRHRNGILQDRNIFVADGQIMTVVRYHKSQSQWDKPKIVPRFLPPQLGQVMAVYLVYIQPFKEYLTLQVLGGSYNDYVWHDAQGAWDTGRLTRVLRRETGKRLGVALHTLDYRHTAVGIGRVKVGESFSKGYQDDVGEIEEAEVEEDGEDVLELQNSRTTAMGVGNYSVPMDIIKNLSVRSIDAFRPLSMGWHRFLGVDGTNEAHQTAVVSVRGARKRPLRESISGVALLPRDKEVRVEDPRKDSIYKALQQVLKTQEVGFRSVEQEQAMHAVLDGQNPLVVVLPTGGGKSLLFTVPAVVEQSRVTIVVVPYRALIENLVARIRESGIECIEWKHGENNLASVVVVSADLAGDITSNGNFVAYAGLLLQKGLLRRVVVDECHLIFTSSDWRPKLALLKNLRLLGCPVVLLTATLPPVREHELESSMLVHNATYIRASTVRPRTRYFISWVQRDKIEETALTMCSRRQTQLRKHGLKGVVYCRSKKLCEKLADALDCPHYHAAVVDRAERLRAWEKEGGLIMATSALGTGVDYPGIVYIMHVGMPWSMIDFAQESGRGGRAGEAVDSVILVEHGEVERTLSEKGDDIDVQAMGVFIVGSGCRRLLMSRYLDRTGMSCSDVEGSAGCDRCGDGIRQWLDEQERRSYEWQQVEELFYKLRQGCAICWLFGQCEAAEDRESWKEHQTMKCERDVEVNARVVDDFRRKISDGGGGHSCRRCWVSQKYCATGEKWDSPCQWPNVVIPLAYAAMAVEDGQQIVWELGFKGTEKEEYAKWLGTRHRERVWGEFFSNAMVTAVKIILQFGEL